MSSDRQRAQIRPRRRALAVATVLAVLTAAALAASAVQAPSRIEKLEARIAALEFEVDRIQYRCGCD